MDMSLYCNAYWNTHFRKGWSERRGGEVAWSLMMVTVIVECLWLREQGRPTRQILWWEFVTGHPARMQRQIKYMTS